MEQKINPTWGYRDDGSAQIFDLKEGESLPDGWDTVPKPWNHPNTRHLYNRPAEPAPQTKPDLPLLPAGQAPESGEPTAPAEPASQAKPRRGRPPKSHENDEQPGAELASELRDE